MRGLKHTLQVRRISLQEWKLFGEAFERHDPILLAGSTSDFEEAV
jgi:hypothetical protein